MRMGGIAPWLLLGGYTPLPMPLYNISSLSYLSGASVCVSLGEVLRLGRTGSNVSVTIARAAATAAAASIARSPSLSSYNTGPALPLSTSPSRSPSHPQLLTPAFVSGPQEAFMKIVWRANGRSGGGL